MWARPAYTCKHSCAHVHTARSDDTSDIKCATHDHTSMSIHVHTKRPRGTYACKHVSAHLRTCRPEVSPQHHIYAAKYSGHLAIGKVAQQAQLFFEQRCESNHCRRATLRKWPYEAHIAQARDYRTCNRWLKPAQAMACTTLPSQGRAPHCADCVFLHRPSHV